MSGNPVEEAKALRAQRIANGEGTRRFCRGEHCGAEIWMLDNPATGKPAPFNKDGDSHFATCPDRNRFSRSQRRKRA